MAKGRGRAGTHTSVTDAARPVVALFEKHGRVSRGVIQARVGARRHSIKVMPLDGGLRVTVVSKGSRQELHVYGVTVAQARGLLATPELTAYLIHFAGE